MKCILGIIFLCACINGTLFAQDTLLFQDSRRYVGLILSVDSHFVRVAPFASPTDSILVFPITQLSQIRTSNFFIRHEINRLGSLQNSEVPYAISSTTAASNHAAFDGALRSLKTGRRINQAFWGGLVVLAILDPEWLLGSPFFLTLNTITTARAYNKLRDMDLGDRKRR